MNVAEAVAATKALDYGTLLSPERAAYHAGVAHIKSEFLAYIKDEYGYGWSDEMATRITARAWEEGHASGFYSVQRSAIQWNELLAVDD